MEAADGVDELDVIRVEWREMRRCRPAIGGQAGDGEKMR